MIETKDGAWFKLDEAVGFGLLSREEIIERCRREGASVESDAAVAVFISNDKNEICYAVDGNDGLVFWDCGCFTPADYDETCEAVAKALEAC